jgi:hypothetical protein
MSPWLTPNNEKSVGRASVPAAAISSWREPLSRFWPRLTLKGLSWLPPELLL